jgi:hypothetical protein
MIEKISLESLDEMVDYITELGRIYKKHEPQNCLFNPLIFLKMLMLPFYEDEKLKEKEEFIKRIIETTPCSDRSSLYQEQFLIFYKDWLNKHYPDIYARLFKIPLFKTDDFFEIERIKTNSKIDEMQQQELIDAKTFMTNSDIDDKLILDLVRSLKKMKTLSAKYNELSEDYVGELFYNDEFIQVFQFSIEFRDIAYSLELLKIKLISLDFENLSQQQKTILKTMMDGILADLDDWIHQVLIEQTTRDIHYLDASLLANITQIDIILKSLEEDNQEDEVELF